VNDWIQLRLPAVRVEDRRFLGQVVRFAAALSSMFIGYGLIQPLISLYTSGFVGASYLLVGALMSTIGLVKAGMGPVSGFLSDTYGRKTFASVGALSIAVALAIVTLAGSTAHIVLAFVLYGLGQAFFFLALMTSMVEVAGPGRRALALGLYEGVNGFSILVGTSLSGPMTKAYGLKSVFGVASAFSLLSFLVCVLLVGETMEGSGPQGGVFDFRGVREFISREYFTGMYSAFLFMYTHSLFMAVIPLYTTLTVGMPVESLPALFIAFSGSTAFGSFLAGPISDRVGRRTPIAAGMIVTAASFAALLLLRSPSALALASLALGFGTGFFHPVASAIVADVSTMETRGKAFGFYRLTRDLGTFAGPAVSGVVSSLLGVDALFVLCVSLSVVGAILAAFVIEETLGRNWNL
jgi:MFS family permease